MLGRYLPSQQDFNQIISEDKKPSAGIPFNPHLNQALSQNADPAVVAALFNKYRSFIATEIKDQNPLSIMQLADIYFLKENFSKAEGLYQKVVKISTNFLPAYEKAILSAMLQFPTNYQNTDPSRNNILRERINSYFIDYLQAAERRTDILHKYTLFRLSMFLDRKNEVAEESIINLNEILKKQADNFQAMDTLGFVYLNYKDDINTARQWFSKALKLNKNHTYSLNNLGVCFSKDNKPEDAKKYFEQALRVDSNFPLALENLGNLQAVDKEYHDAYKNLKHAFELNGSISRNGYHNLALSSSETGHYEEAIAMYQNILNFEPDNFLVMNNIGTAYSRFNQKDKARDYYNSSLKTYKKNITINGQNIPGITNTLRNLLRTAVDARDIPLVEKAIQELRDINSNDPYLYYGIGCIELLKEHYDEASNAFEELLKKDKHVPEMYVMYSFLLSAVQRNYEGTIALLEGAVKLGYSNLLTDNNLAYAYLNLDKTKKAAEILSKYKEPLPDVLLPTFGMLNIRTNNLEEGNEFYKKALSVVSDNKIKKELNQIWLFEQALYWTRKKDNKKARLLLEEAINIGKTYVSDALDELYAKIS